MSWSKVKNLDPLVHGKMHWGQIAKKNRKAMDQKLMMGQLVRNLPLDTDKALQMRKHLAGCKKLVALFCNSTSVGASAKPLIQEWQSPPLPLADKWPNPTPVQVQHIGSQQHQIFSPGPNASRSDNKQLDQMPAQKPPPARPPPQPTQRTQSTQSPASPAYGTAACPHGKGFGNPVKDCVAHMEGYSMPEPSTEVP
jgi:hypothetical protein